MNQNEKIRDLYFNRNRNICGWLLVLLCFVGTSRVTAQRDSLSVARVAVTNNDYAKALPIFEKALAEAPSEYTIYESYFAALIAAKDYKKAEDIVNKFARFLQPSLSKIDLGTVLIASGKEKKGRAAYDEAIAQLNGDDYQVQLMVKKLLNAGQTEYALKVYERVTQLFQNPYLYSGQMAKLYAQTGATDKAVDALLDGATQTMAMMNFTGNNSGLNDVKASLLEILGDEPTKLQLGQKAIIRRINNNPQSELYAELLTWVYTQKGNWDGALIQMQAIDERNSENGWRLLSFAQNALKEGQTSVAVKAINTVIEKGKENPLYATGRAMQLEVAYDHIVNDVQHTEAEITQLIKDYDAFFTDLPEYKTTDALRDYARIEALYNNNVTKGAALVQAAIALPNASKDFVGHAKLDLGDYQIVQGKVWDAALTYGQVDKAFKEDMLGEEARFKNAKLAYYRGDFDWAQGQLTVLKASTSELIANDALALSILITENVPDSQYAPLVAFARADLLLFQNKDEAANALLDSMSSAFPKHSLNDDMLMLRAQIALKHKEYNKALSYWAEVNEKYGKDVLADDAMYKTAQLYDEVLHQKEDAKKYYEQVIVAFPGSTYTPAARQKLLILNSDANKTNL